MTSILKKILAAILLFLIKSQLVFSQTGTPELHYTISIPEPGTHNYNVELRCNNWRASAISLKMPAWMPGYYQLMDYAKTVEQIKASDEKGKPLPVVKKDSNTWEISGIRNNSFTVSYSIHTSRQFVANSYVDSAHAYIIPGNTFLYIENKLQIPVSVKLLLHNNWNAIATGLDAVVNKPGEFTAPDFDILYDCPILAGNLQELPSFNVNGIKHRFIGYKLAPFNHNIFMQNLQKIVEAASGIIGHIPYKQYTFIGIGPGRGGIEHLNNTTVSFDGSGLDKPGVMNRTMNFLAHEYFHHYNVKRIRPFELGPFDYDKGSRTNLLWVSEGLSVYYEYLIVKRAGLSDEATLLANFEGNLNAHENNPGRQYQSLQQASYATWSDGPFGTQGNEKGKAISYYDKGPLVGLLLDFEIRNATENKKSLDDVMRLLYQKYYRQLQRGFTEAELQQACEQTAGKPLSSFFEYIYTTKELDYGKYLAYAGLKIEQQNTETKDKAPVQKLVIRKADNPTTLQTAIFEAWSGK